MSTRRTALLLAAALAAGTLALVGGSIASHRGPPPRLQRLLEHSRLGDRLVQAWLRAATPSAATTLHRGDRLPARVLPDPDGHPQALTQWHGKRVLLNFWATWCGPCRREMPALAAAQRRYGDDGVQVVGIAVDRAPAVRAWLRRAPTGYPVLIDADGALSRRLGDDAGLLPYSVLVDADGRITATHYGPLQPAQLRWWLAP